MSLKNLRSDPTAACNANVYRTTYAVSAQTPTVGGRCTISETTAAKGFYDLAASSSAIGTDYYFPWVRTGVGTVSVPKGVPDGTIVLTGGLNGCTIVASEFGNNYHFYHDGDSKYLKDTDITGNELARVEPKDYDPLGWGQKQFENALQEASEAGIAPKGDVSYAHYVVAVKRQGRFGFYATGLMSLNGLTKLPFAHTTCIVTFA